jgi:DNA invertase Pin-like site-specific DNA recombinase
MGIGLQFLRCGPIDTAAASGEPFFNIFAAVAQFEAELIRERTRAELPPTRPIGRKPDAGSDPKP